MTPDLSLLSGFARGVLLSLHVRDMYLHSGSWLLSGLGMAEILYEACIKGSKCTYEYPLLLSDSSSKVPEEELPCQNSESLCTPFKASTLNYHLKESPFGESMLVM